MHYYNKPDSRKVPIQRKFISDLATVDDQQWPHSWWAQHSIVHEVRQILHLVGGGGQLLLSVGKLVLLNGSYDNN